MCVIWEKEIVTDGGSDGLNECLWPCGMFSCIRRRMHSFCLVFFCLHTKRDESSHTCCEMTPGKRLNPRANPHQLSPVTFAQNYFQTLPAATTFGKLISHYWRKEKCKSSVMVKRSMVISSRKENEEKVWTASSLHKHYSSFLSLSYAGLSGLREYGDISGKGREFLESLSHIQLNIKLQLIAG